MKILEIVEGDLPIDADHDYYTNVSEGVLIKTDEEDGNIKIAIYGTPGCCEHFGYNLIFPNELSAGDFIGEDILNVFSMEADDAPENLDSYAHSDGVTYGVETNKGLIILNVFNHHNGYYGHGYSFESKYICVRGTL